MKSKGVQGKGYGFMKGGYRKMATIGSGESTTPHMNDGQKKGSRQTGKESPAEVAKAIKAGAESC